MDEIIQKLSDEHGQALLDYYYADAVCANDPSPQAVAALQQAFARREQAGQNLAIACASYVNAHKLR